MAVSQKISKNLNQFKKILNIKHMYMCFMFSVNKTHVYVFYDKHAYFMDIDIAANHSE